MGRTHKTPRSSISEQATSCLGVLDPPLHLRPRMKLRSYSAWLICRRAPLIAGAAWRQGGRPHPVGRARRSVFPHAIGTIANVRLVVRMMFRFHVGEATKRSSSWAGLPRAVILRAQMGEDRLTAPIIFLARPASMPCLRTRGGMALLGKLAYRIVPRARWPAVPAAAWYR